MTIRTTTSLAYRFAQPKTGDVGKPPLLLLLHGYGSNEDDLFSLAPYLDERFLIISARAPVALTSYSFASFAWFSLGFTPQGVIIDEQEAESSRLALHAFIKEVAERNHVDPGAVYLMGFSQGAMMGLSVALTFPGTAAAVVAMSGRLFPQTLAQITDRDALSGLPIFISHGTRDTLLPIHHARDARSKLSELPVDLTYHEYRMGHEINEQSLRDITGWLTLQLNSTRSLSVVSE
ncbi:MAG: alpha/beta fold hydrolase [Acidobacteria bacterium]|nr:alpha/beta fold hydrolase [Acidobacteriota bacterium]